MHGHDIFLTYVAHSRGRKQICHPPEQHAFVLGCDTGLRRDDSRGGYTISSDAGVNTKKIDKGKNVGAFKNTPCATNKKMLRRS